MTRWLAMLVLLLLGCSPGPYPVDVFPEMHYSPAQRRGEPSRLAPPDGAVPISGARPAYTFDEAAALPNPSPATSEAALRGDELFRVNCSMCHGADGRGHSLVAERFRALGAVPPSDLSSQRVRDRTDGQVYWIIANGIGNMPPFGGLLSEDELWLVTQHVRQLQ